MASIFDFSSTAGSNGTVDGTNIAEGCAPGNLNNAIRSLMAIIRQTFSATLQNFLSGAAPLGVASGGTGSATAADARSALSAAKSGANSDITSLTGLTTALSVAQGGTGATTAAAAGNALGVVGVGQSWAQVSRSANTTYQNTTGRPIMVAWEHDGDNAFTQVSSNGSSWITLGIGNERGQHSFIVPDDHYYRISGSANVYYAAVLS